MNTIAHYFLKFFAWGVSLLGTGILIAFIGAMVIFQYFSKDLPDYSKLANYQPSSMTRLYTDDGRIMAEYAEEKRIFKPLKDIPIKVIRAFIAAEDRNFYHHQGIDAKGVARAIIKNIENLGAGKSLVGGSTITQQVVKNFLLTKEKSFTRKIKEAILAVRISKAYSKDRILELYLNEIYLGIGAYGVAIASQRYFDKPLSDLTTEEAALLAAMPKAPSAFDPRHNYERALKRRNYVIKSMYDEGYINLAESSHALEQPIKLAKKRKKEIVKTGFFAEEVRRKLVKEYSKEAVYRGGLYVKTTMNPKLQEIADKTLRNALRNYDKRHGYRGAIENIPIKSDENQWIAELQEIANKITVFDGQRLAMVLNVKPSKVSIGFGDGEKSILPFAGMKWARKVSPRSGLVAGVPKSAKNVVKRGDIIIVTPRKFNDDGVATSYNLTQEPAVNGALVAMDPHTGRVLAMAGGYNSTDHFNRATQAKRQPGSAFKPFVYIAALERGFTPASIVMDEPVEISQGEGKPMWRPKNYGGKFIGPTTLRVGLEKSRNLMTVNLAKMIDIKRVINIGERFGIYNKLPSNYSMVLGSMETTLMKLTRAYAMIANGGVNIKTTYIDRVDNNLGQTILRANKEICLLCAENYESFDHQIKTDSPPILLDNSVRILDSRVAFQMTSMLEGVVKRGTATKARVLGFPVGGKTGTTNNSRDAWFMGFSRDLVVGVYIGFDKPKSLGRKETGGSVAMPAFVEFMKKAQKAKDVRKFYEPKGIAHVKIDRYTGDVPLPWNTTPVIIDEVFLSGGSIFIPEGEDEGLPDVVLPFTYLEHIEASSDAYYIPEEQNTDGYDYSGSGTTGDTRFNPDDGWQSLNNGALLTKQPRSQRNETRNYRNKPYGNSVSPNSPTIYKRPSAADYSTGSNKGSRPVLRQRSVTGSERERSEGLY